MKRILLPASGAVLATGLLAAGLAGSAQAADDVATDPLAKSVEQVTAIIDFWTKSNNEALKSATAYYWDAKDVKKLVSKGGYVADGKPGLSAPTAARKVTTPKVQNVNLPKTIGKVFFEGRDGKLYWCTGSSIQSNYRNLVATAGHCVYDVKGNDEVVSRWVFVPGYYQGKTPYGIYVGKQAFTHYDFDVYEDFDRDYAFVTVYNGIGGAEGKVKEVSEADFKAYKGEKFVKTKDLTEAEYKKCREGLQSPETSDCYSVTKVDKNVVGSPDHKDTVLSSIEVTKAEFQAAPAPSGDAAPSKPGNQPANYTKGDTKLWVYPTKEQWDAYKGKGYKFVDAGGNYLVEEYFLNVWVIAEIAKTTYHSDSFFIVERTLTDLGRLGDNVGDQGFAWNQPTGKYVRVFGYPYNPHPDGHKQFTGVTPKWCYGKTTAKTVQAPSYKVEEHVALKCNMTGGADGGPWLYQYSNAKRLGYINGVTSLFSDQDGNDRVDYISSPYFDGETAAVYNAAKNVWSGPILPVKK